jgi:hypothetical protein
MPHTGERWRVPVRVYLVLPNDHGIRVQFICVMRVDHETNHGSDSRVFDCGGYVF